MLGPLVDSATISLLRARFDSSSTRSLLIPDLLDETDARALRARLDGAGFAPYWVADRGRYQIQLTHSEPELFRILQETASQVAQTVVAPGKIRWLRLAHGDYALFKGDDARGEPARHLELTLDFSATSTGEAETGYLDGGGGNVVIPQRCRSLAIVERSAGLVRSERYLTHRVGASQVYRLRMTLYPTVPV